MNFFKAIKERIRRYDDTHNFTCDVCGREVFANERVCEKCVKALPWNDKIVCPLCGRKGKESGVCLACKERPLAVERARSAFLHEGEAARLVVRFKRGQKYLYRTLAELALPLLQKEFPDAEALTFVPMTKRAERKRGFNQARLFSEELSRLCGIPTLATAEKRRETKMQKLLGREERESNLAGSFCVTDADMVRGKTLVIVDDTLTTGATVGELATVLKKAGAAKVYAFTFTSVENKPRSAK